MLDMGRIKTRLVKRVTHDLVREHGSELTADFNQNKLAVSKFVDVQSKKMRNIIAGYATRIIRKQQN
jgi:small subunit ribosomal protein S17e